MTKRASVIGLLIAAAYIVAAIVSFDAGLLPVRPLYDGTAPPPTYRWVEPPPDLAADNLPPEPGTGTLTFAKGAFEANTISTADAQAVVIFPPEAVKPRKGERTVEVTITPLAPATVGAVPRGAEYNSNAYRIEAVYAKSGEPVELVKPVSVVLRYAFGADAMYRRDGEAWVSLGVTPSAAALQIFADTQALGVFVATGPPTTGPVKHDSRAGDIIAAVAGLLVVAGGIFFGRWRVHAKRQEDSRRAAIERAKKKRPR